MTLVDEIEGWEAGGSLAGRGLNILGTNKETGAVCYLKTIGPTRSSSTSYSVKVAMHNDSNGKIIERGIEKRTRANIRAMEFMEENLVVYVDDSSVTVKLYDENENRIW